MTLEKETTAYVQALGYRWLTRLYDPVVRLLKEEKFKRLLVEQAAIRAGGSRSRPSDAVRRRSPSCSSGPVWRQRSSGWTAMWMCWPSLGGKSPWRSSISSCAREWRRRRRLNRRRSTEWSQSRLPPSHHRRKRRTLAKMRELLRPGGELHIADWGQARNFPMRVAFLGVQLLDGFETTTDSVRGHLIPLMQEAGFTSVSETHREMTILGTLALYRATTPRVSEGGRMRDGRRGERGDVDQDKSIVPVASASLNHSARA